MDFLEFFARAGGGGSSSSGGGGVGLVTIPGIVSCLVARMVKNKAESKIAGAVSGLLAGLLVSVLYFVIGGTVWLVIAVVSACVGVPIGVFSDTLGAFRKNSKAAQQVVAQAGVTDAMWSQQQIIDYATQVFMRFQYDWGKMDLVSIQHYTTPEYAKHIGLMLYAMQQMGRVNTMQSIKIDEAVISYAYDGTNNEDDRVSVAFSARAHDVLQDMTSGKQLTVNNDGFVEQWNFVRHENTWLLYGIDQATEDSAMIVSSLRQFAQQNAMYYSPDWGNLLLPTRGQLFKHGFKNADINNHVIGFWTGNLLVQLYTYNSGRDNDVTHYMVGQINLPKSYGGILIRRRDSGFLGRFGLGTPKGYKDVSLEWGDFNQRYKVCATDEDQVTSFELLNPGFMAWLYDQDLKVNIEVVDNVVYLYAKISTGEQRYADMLTILQKSHKELKM